MFFSVVLWAFVVASPSRDTEAVVFLSTIVSKMIALPAAMEAFPLALTSAPTTVTSFFASRLRVPVDSIPAFLPMTVSPPSFLAKVSFLILPSVETKLTLPPLMVPLVLVISSLVLTVNLPVLAMVPPVLVKLFASMSISVAVITAPVSTASLVACAK